MSDHRLTNQRAEAEAEALKIFTDYFVKNYPGPDTIIHDPNWHAPKIFRAALNAMKWSNVGRLPDEPSEQLHEYGEKS